MTATNHALTGAVIALVVKKPELAIPLAFLSHFAIDVIPHYNPKDVKGFNKLEKKFQHQSFWLIFGLDMLIWPLLLVGLPLLLNTTVSPWTIFFSILASVSPDFVDGYYFLSAVVFGKKVIKSTWFDRFAISIQKYEKPPGLIIEFGWMILMVWLIHNLTK